MFKIGNVEIKNNIVLAPLAGYTNPSYLRIMKEMGVGLVYSEMISARGLLYDNDKTWELTKIYDDTHPIAMQLFGSDVSDMVNAAILLDTKTDCDIIDINMGCPVRKVLKQGAGSKLLEDVDKIYEIVKNVVQNVNKPVSVKIRAGLDHSNINCVEVAKMVEKAGASAICIHGRTRSDLYKGKTNLSYIKMVKDAVKIPVIGNGDIKTIEDAKNMFDETKVDAVMIGRGSYGNPWFIRDVVDYFDGNKLKDPPNAKDRCKMCIKHFLSLCELKGDKLAILEFRSIAPWYLKTIPCSKDAKYALTTIKTKEEFLNIFDNLIKTIV